MNFRAPTSTLQTLVGSGKSVTAFAGTKRRLDEPWGDFTVVWNVVASRAKEAKEEDLSDRDAYHAISDDDDSLNSSTQVLCPECKTINSRKDQRCVKCEKILEDDF